MMHPPRTTRLPCALPFALYRSTSDTQSLHGPMAQTNQWPMVWSFWFFVVTFFLYTISKVINSQKGSLITPYLSLQAKAYSCHQYPMLIILFFTHHFGSNSSFWSWLIIMLGQFSPLKSQRLGCESERRLRFDWVDIDFGEKADP